MIKLFIKKILRENTEWQYAATKNLLDNIGYTSFMKSLSSEDREKLRAELSHHLMSGLTPAISYVETNKLDKASIALEKMHERYTWLIKTLVGE